MKRTLTSTLRILTLVSALSTHVVSRGAGPSTETKLTPGDLFRFRDFGAAVAIDGDTVVVGAPLDPEAGPNAGAAFVFVRAGSTWSQQAKLSPGGGSGQFGTSVAISGDTIVVGAPLDSGAGSGVGAAYVFVRTGTSWSQQARLTPSYFIGNDMFGTSIAVDGDTLAIGAIGTGRTYYYEGMVYVYERSGGAWTEQAQLSSDIPGPGNEFGFSVALENGTLAIGSPFDDDLLFADAGAVYVFTGSGATWTLQAELMAGDADDDDRLGWSVALDADTIVAGAPQNDQFVSPYGPGAAYVFARSGSVWTEQSKLVADDPVLGDAFGYAVAVNNDTALIGSLYDSSFATTGGSAYTFTRAGSTWNQDAEFSASDIAQDLRFGYTVAINGTTFLSGAPLGGMFQDGAAYVYESSSSNTAPIADPQSVATQEDTPVAITLTGSDAESDPLTFSVLSGPAHGSLSGTAPNLTYTPNANFNGADSFSFKANDGVLDSAPATVSITVAPVNDAPVAGGQTVETSEDTAVAITLTGSDVEGSPLTFVVISAPSNGTLSGTAPDLSYTPNANFNGTDGFTFKVNDGELDSATATVTINVNPVNDAPTISDIPDQTIAKNSTTGPVSFIIGDVDNDPATLIVSGSSDNPSLVPDAAIVFGGSGANRTVKVTPAANQSGTATITVTVSDGTATSSDSFVVTVTTGNHAPVADASASDMSVVAHNNKFANITLDGSRSYDPDNDSLTYSWREGASALGSGSVLHLKLDVGAHVVTLTVSDGSLTSSTTFIVDITAAEVVSHTKK